MKVRLCEVVQQISTSAPTSDSVSTGWITTAYIQDRHMRERKEHTHTHTHTHVHTQAYQELAG